MSIQLKICRDLSGTWSVHGLSPVPQPHLPSLPASIEYARRACDAAPATIEFFIDGLYLVAHQENGWPRSLVAAQSDRMHQSALEPDLGRTPIWNRFLSWLRTRRHWSAKPSPAALGGQNASRAASLGESNAVSAGSDLPLERLH